GFGLALHDCFERCFRLRVTPEGSKVSFEASAKIRPGIDGPWGQAFVPGHCSFP
ncbi:hypothetical protein A2U01_0105933, partial [Trifolium medium]|nr:hypothetical protein [Trifolium medium]